MGLVWVWSVGLVRTGQWVWSGLVSGFGQGLVSGFDQGLVSGFGLGLICGFGLGLVNGFGQDWSVVSAWSAV